MPDSGISSGDLKAIAAGYVRYSEILCTGAFNDSPEMLADERVYTEVQEAVCTVAPDRLWELILAVLEQAPDETLDVYAAGLLEDAVRVRGAELVGAIEAEAARDERFRWALGLIWLSKKEMSAEIVDRIVRASGGVIRPLD